MPPDATTGAEEQDGRQQCPLEGIAVVCDDLGTGLDAAGFASDGPLSQPVQGRTVDKLFEASGDVDGTESSHTGEDLHPGSAGRFQGSLPAVAAAVCPGRGSSYCASRWEELYRQNPSIHPAEGKQWPVAVSGDPVYDMQGMQSLDHPRTWSGAVRCLYGALSAPEKAHQNRTNRTFGKSSADSRVLTEGRGNLPGIPATAPAAGPPSKSVAQTEGSGTANGNVNHE